MLQKISLFLGILLMSLALTGTAEAAKAKTQYVSLSKGRTLAYQQIQGKGGQPTLVILPGIFRSLPSDYPALKILLNQGFGVVTFATSSHWESLRGLKVTDTPYFEQKADLGLADLAGEAEALVRYLGVQNPILVSLSYSSSIAASSQLPGIFVAPMVRASDSDPQAAAAAALWEAGLAMNPYFGDIWIRQYRDNNYRTYWSSVVFQNGGSRAYGDVDASDIIDGYSSLSRAAENFDLKRVKFSAGGSQFLIGERESQIRLKGQFAAAKKAARAGPTRMILVVGAEHNVPDTAPEAYALGLVELVQPVGKIGLQIGVLDIAKSSDVRWLSTLEAKKLFSFVEKLSDSTLEADLSSVLAQF